MSHTTLPSWQSCVADKRARSSSSSISSCHYCWRQCTCRWRAALLTRWRIAQFAAGHMLREIQNYLRSPWMSSAPLASTATFFSSDICTFPLSTNFCMLGQYSVSWSRTFYRLDSISEQWCLRRQSLCWIAPCHRASSTRSSKYNGQPTGGDDLTALSVVTSHRVPVRVFTSLT